MDVKDVAKADVHRCLDPIWKTKTITADRVRNRIERVIGWAIAREHRPPGTNPAAWTDHLEHSLPKHCFMCKRAVHDRSARRSRIRVVRS
jgi:Phage integrase central domain